MEEFETPIRIIYRIYSEDNNVVNYVDYDPSKSFRRGRKRFERFVSEFYDELSGKNDKEKARILFEKSKCAKMGSKNQKFFTRTPKGCKVVKVVLPNGQKDFCLALLVDGGEAEEYLEISTEPAFWSANGIPICEKIVVKDGGARKGITMFKTEKDCRRTYVLVHVEPRDFKREICREIEEPSR